MRCDPAPVLRITTSDKKTLPLPKTPCKRALEPDVANGVTKILKTVLTNGTASRIGGLDGGRPVAGKTGTSDNSNETWFVGYTPQISTAVWVGTPNDPRNERILRNLRLGDQLYGGQIFGSTIAAPIWKSIMDRSSAGMPVRDFADPGERVQRGELLSIPAVAGMSVADANGALTAAGFRPRVGGGESSSIPAGQVVGTRPGSRAERGSTVVIIVSTGPAAPAPPAPAAEPPPNPGPAQGQPQRGNSGRGGNGGRG
jgi:membrane peptidoglycan carboxypeptidase